MSWVMWQCGIWGTLQVRLFSKLLLEDSTGPPQIWSAKAQDLLDTGLQSFFVFVERCCHGNTENVYFWPWVDFTLSNLPQRRVRIGKNPGLNTFAPPYWVILYFIPLRQCPVVTKAPLQNLNEVNLLGSDSKKGNVPKMLSYLLCLTCVVVSLYH